MSGVREFGHAQSGWAQAQTIMTRPHQVREMDLCNRGAAGKGVVTVKCSPGEVGRGGLGRVSRRSAEEWCVYCRKEPRR